jgi:hypothetical protein
MIAIELPDERQNVLAIRYDAKITMHCMFTSGTRSSRTSAGLSSAKTIWQGEGSMGSVPTFGTRPHFGIKAIVGAFKVRSTFSLPSVRASTSSTFARSWVALNGLRKNSDRELMCYLPSSFSQT